MRALAFAHPEPPRPAHRVRPVFLPFAGCPHRCLFCDQAVQTGCAPDGLEQRFAALERELSDALARGERPFELAFYGGTFTALPAPWPETFLDLARAYSGKGLVSAVRCSTRPDAVDLDGLKRLKGLGLRMVELGVQSFDDKALEAARRGYDGAAARAACVLVRKAGLSLGVQLLPGLPGDRPGVFRADVAITAGLRPKAVRLYPCLVLAKTPLEGLWRSGAYSPWTLGRARAELPHALLRLWRAGAPVIRVGLASEPGLDASVLAGPAHPALGQAVRSTALFRHVRGMVARLGRRPSSLSAPSQAQGEFWGHGRELVRAYARLGLTTENVSFGPGRDFVLA